jgi:lipopolysaccharide heptosyltransferase I
MEDRTVPKDGSPRILIVRLSAIGDVIHGMPVLCALRDHYPGAMLAWVVESRAAALLRGHRAVDELIEIRRGWLTSPRAVWEVRRRLRAMNFDAAIDIQGLTKSAVAAWVSGAPQRIGFADNKGRELSKWLNNAKSPCPARHIIDANLQLLRPLGIESPQVRFDVPEHESDGRTADKIVHRLGVTGGFAVINPGAGWPSKLWPADRHTAVARHLGRKHGLPTLVVWAGAQELAWAEQIVASSGGSSHLAPATTLTELAALCRRARLFIGSDTGPLHLAAAVGTPCVGLHGPMPAERNGPYGASNAAIQVRRFEGTSRQRRNAPREIMEAITVEMVRDGCDRVLGASPVAA